MNIYEITVEFCVPSEKSFSRKTKNFYEKYRIIADNKEKALLIASNLSEKSFSNMIGYISYTIINK